MKKDELIAKVAYVSGQSKEVVRMVLAAVVASVAQSLRSGDVVRLFGLGKLSVAQREERMARNIHTGEPVVVPRRKAVQFSPSTAMVDAANRRKR